MSTDIAVYARKRTEPSRGDGKNDYQEVRSLMAILDLQGMPVPSTEGVRYGKSGSSKGCGNRSGLSLLLC